MLMSLATIDETGMNERTQSCTLTVSPVFAQFVENDLLPTIGVSPDDFWLGLESIINDLTPVNRALLEKLPCVPQEHRLPGSRRRAVQDQDPERRSGNCRGSRATACCSCIQCSICTQRRECALGQSVRCPVRNRRYQCTIPLDGVSHADVNAYGLDHSDDGDIFVASNANGEAVGLVDPKKFAGHRGESGRCVYLFCNHGLHIELIVDPEHPVGKSATANLADVVLPSRRFRIARIPSRPSMRPTRWGCIATGLA
jgi:malate synthase